MHDPWLHVSQRFLGIATPSGRLTNRVISPVLLFDGNHPLNGITLIVQDFGRTTKFGVIGENTT